MNRNPDFVFQSLDQQARGIRFAEAGHVFHRKNVGAHLFELFRHLDVVLEVVLGALGVEDVAGVTDRGFADGIGLEHRFHRHLHVRNPIQGVEHPEHVHTGVRGFFNETLYHVVRVVGVADGV